MTSLGPILLRVGRSSGKAQSWLTSSHAQPRQRRTSSSRTSPLLIAAVALIAGLQVGTLALPALAQTSANQGFITPQGNRQDRNFRDTRATNGLVGPIRKGDKATPLYLNADELEYDTRGNRVIAKGNVEIYYADNALTADRVVYDQGSNTLTAEGNVKVKQPDGAIISSERFVTSADFAEAFVQTLTLVGKDDTRIVARRAIRRDSNVTEFEQGKFTPCKSEAGMPPLWCIAAQRIVHDKEQATITYQDAQVEILGQPVAYLPFFQHADPSVKSRSGFLVPEMGSSNRLGFTTSVPYHFALDPSYDFLFHPRYTSKFGVLYQGDWRQKLRIGDAVGSYNVKLAGIEQGNDSSINADLRDKWRGSVESHGRFSLSSWWQFGWDVIGESDKAFRQYYGLDPTLQTDRINSLFLAGIGGRNYFGLRLYQTGGLILNDGFNTAAPGATVAPNPSQWAVAYAPVVDYNYIADNPVLGGELKFSANAIAHSQDLSFTDGLGVGRNAASSINRVTANVGWRRTLTDKIGQQFTPFVSLRGDLLELKDYVDPVTRLLQDEQSVARWVGTAGLTYSYPWLLATQTAAHTVEPIAQVVAKQNSVDQRRLPNLDSRSQVFDDINLFEEKASGYDRIDTGVRANYGLQYTLQAFNGSSVRALVGQSYHLTGDNIFRNPGVDSDGVLLSSPTTGLQRNSSDYVLGLYVRPVTGFQAVGQTRFDEETHRLRRADATASFNYGLLLTSATYTYSASNPALNLLQEQEEVTGRIGLKLSDRWSAHAQRMFNLSTSRPVQDILQLRYVDECLVMTASYLTTDITDVNRNIVPDRTIMLRMELKYLGEFRYKTDVLNFATGVNQAQPQ